MRIIDQALPSGNRKGDHIEKMLRPSKVIPLTMDEKF